MSAALGRVGERAGGQLGSWTGEGPQPGSGSEEACCPGPPWLLTGTLLPAGSDRNSYSLYCAELMANMKDVPSTERMVLCSQQWKLLSQKEKDAYHKKCDQVSCGKEDSRRPSGVLGV